MLHIYCAGELIRDPEQRTAKTGISYTTALVRCSDALMSVTCFDAALAAQLLALRKGDPVSVPAGCRPAPTPPRTANRAVGWRLPSPG